MTIWMNFLGPGFTLIVPSDWLIQATPEIQVIFLAPETNQMLQTNLMITLRPVEPSVTVVDIAAFLKETQQTDYAEFVLTREQPINAGTIAGIERMFQWVDRAENMRVGQCQGIFVHQEVLFTLTITYALEEKERIQPIFDEIVDSLRLVE